MNETFRSIFVFTVLLMFCYVCYLSVQDRSSISNLEYNQTSTIPWNSSQLIHLSNNSMYYRKQNEEWYKKTRNASFTFLEDLDLREDNSLYISRVTTDIDTLKQICQRTFKCLAFNTSGVLMTLPPSNQLYREITKQNNSLYVLDIDYCDLNVCPPNTVCKYHGPGNYTCSLDSSVHVVLSVDSSQFSAIFPLLYSLKQHHTKPLIVHIVVNKKDSQELQIQLECRGLMMSMKIEIVEFEVPVNFTQLIYVRHMRLKYLSSTANFARFFFDQLFPSLSHILYLDVDTIVLHDISELWNEIVTSDKLLVVIQRSIKYKSFLFAVSSLYKERYGKSIDMSTPSFNAGVYGVNLDMWRRENIYDEIVYWMKMNKKTRLWDLGTQPILYLIAYGNVKNVDSRWNLEGLGCKGRMNEAKLSDAYIHHWNGLAKPWMKHVSRGDSRYDYWDQYNKPECNGHGSCSKVTRKCVCIHDYKGTFCDEKK